MTEDKNLELLGEDNGLNEADVICDITDDNITPEMSEEYADGKGGED